MHYILVDVIYTRIGFGPSSKEYFSESGHKIYLEYIHTFGTECFIGNSVKVKTLLGDERILSESRFELNKNYFKHKCCMKHEWLCNCAKIHLNVEQNKVCCKLSFIPKLGSIHIPNSDRCSIVKNLLFLCTT